MDVNPPPPATPCTATDVGRPLQAHEIELLRALHAAGERLGAWRDGYVRPMDAGGTSNSHHHRTLQVLVRAGFVEKEQRHSWTRRSFLYRVTPAGRRLLSRESHG